MKDPEKIIQRYREYVYDAGTVGHPDKPGSKVIDKKILAKEQKKGFKVTRIDRFRNQTRYFSDSGIIGKREFVSRHYRMFKDRFKSMKEKQPKPRSLPSYRSERMLKKSIDKLL